MDFNEYQREALKFQLKTARDSRYLVLGLCSEAGEVAGKLKKGIRDGKPDDAELISECGDVLWYIAAIADHYGISLQYLAVENLEKLKSRAKRGKIKGSGDKR